MILQNLRTAITTAALELDTAKREKADTWEAESKYKALSEIWAYVRSGVWSPREETARKAVFILEHGRDIAIQKGIVKSAHSSVVLLGRANEYIGRKIEAQWIDDILQGNIHDTMLKFRLATGYLLASNAFVQEVSNLLPEGSSEPEYTLEECLTEIKFLAFYSRPILEKRFNSVDKDRLAYLVHLLNSYDPNKRLEQEGLYRVLNGEATADSLKSNKIFPDGEKPT